MATARLVAEEREPLYKAARRRRDEDLLRRADLVAAALLIATVCFNAGLAWVNAHIVGINNGVVTLVQAVLVFAAIGVAAVVQPEGAGRWFAFGFATLGLVTLLMLLRTSLDPKAVADVLTVPAFAILGLCMKRETLIRTLILLQIVLVTCVLWELFIPVSFGDFFNVRSYYVATRGFSESSFYTGEADKLFLTSQRGGGRILKVGFDIERGSSLFLEPVSLGNWTIAVTVALVSFWREISRRDRVVLLASNLLLIIGCDGRLALATNIVLFLGMPAFSRLPRLVAFLYLPALYLAIVSLTALGLIALSADGYDSSTGRFIQGVEILHHLAMPEFFGLEATTGGLVHADSGWTYITLKQSLLGLVALWGAVTLMVPDSDRGRRFAHAAGIFVALGLPISNSIVSIKVAAALWMIAGCVTREELAAREPGRLPAG